MKNENKVDKNPGFLSDKTTVIFIIMLVIVTALLLTLWISKANDLETDSDLVVELHNYFSYESIGNCEGLFNYSDSKVEYSDVDSETKICLAYQKAEKETIETETIKKSKKKNTCTLKDEMVFKVGENNKECEIKKIKKDSVDNEYKKMYGKDIEDNKKFRIDNLNVCYLDGDYYYCGLSETSTYILGNESVIYRVVRKAEEKGSNIVMYDYFVKINGDNCYKNYTTSTINKECTNNFESKDNINYKFMKNYGTQYKHVFKEADNGTYYWISSEPLK